MYSGLFTGRRDNYAENHEPQPNIPEADAAVHAYCGFMLLKPAGSCGQLDRDG